VAIHTIVAAAHQILWDLVKKAGEEGFMDKVLDQIKPEKKRGFLKRFREAQNFFKHADNDDGDTIEFNPDSTEVYIAGVLLTQAKLTSHWSQEGNIFMVLFCKKFPDIVNGWDPFDLVPKELADTCREILSDEGLEVFYAYAADLLEANRPVF